MPKVETSLTPGGKFSTDKIYVSFKNGIGNHIQNYFIRNKRELQSNVSSDNNSTRRKVIKKLRRIQPVQNNVNKMIGKHQITESTTKRLRKKLIIKKKKKRRLMNSVALDNESHLEQATKPRRKVIITKKRLVPTKSKYNETNHNNNILHSSVGNILTSSLIKETHNNYVEHESYNEVINDNDDSEDYATETPEENLTENYEITTSDFDNFHFDTGTNSLFESNLDYPENTEENLEKPFDDDQNTDTDDISSFKNEIFTTEEAEYKVEEDDEINNQPTFQDIPEYEPSFPELTESLDSASLRVKTTVLSSVEYVTDTLTESRLRTYTFVVTRLSGDEEVVTSTTEVKPQIKTTVVTKPFTTYTTLTLLDFDSSDDEKIKDTKLPNLDNFPSLLLNQDFSERSYNEEARYNLATRVMSNGVEVIVAGDKSTLPGDPDYRRYISTNINRPVTLKPSTLTDQMIMMLPQDVSSANNMESAVYPDQFITKTCLTTFTYLTTFLEGSTTTVSSHEQVVSNVATEERNTGKILPTPAVGITLTQYPNLSVGTFHTTYTYLNTILDGEQPLVVSSKHTVTNTVTAPDDYLSLLKPSETGSALKDTNTYFSTIGLEKTLYEGTISSVISTSEVVTQVIITESIPPKATSVMTSYIALDMHSELSPYSTTDVVKTYFVTYTYYNTLEENGQKVIHTNISTSSDVVTEKIYIQPKKNTGETKVVDSISKEEKKKHKNNAGTEKFKLLTTKTLLETSTYYKTLLQDENKDDPTVVSVGTTVFKNVSTETLDPSLLDKKYLKIIRSEINKGSSVVVKVANLQNGKKVEVTAVANDFSSKIQPTKVLPIEKTQMPDITTQNLVMEASSPGVITGSTIVFIDDDPFAQLAATPVLTHKSKAKPSTAVNVVSVLSSQVVENIKVSTAIVKSKKSNKRKSKTNGIVPTKTDTVKKQNTHSHDNAQKQPSDDKKQTGSEKLPPSPGSDLLGLGSININSLQALTPVLNAMAGLITTNLKSNRRSDVNVTVTTTPRPKPNKKIGEEKVISQSNLKNRSPVYIPVGGVSDDFEIAESQNIATFDWVDPPHQDPSLPGKPTHEMSLLNGGIPISPGDIITANSDVIVGKPGRVGPRIPAIPLSQNFNEGHDIPLDMKPPPVSNKHWPKQHHQYKHIPLEDVVPERPTIIHSPNKNDYIGPPPPPPHSLQATSEDRIKPIVLLPPSASAGSYYNDNKIIKQNEVPSGSQIYAQNQNTYYISNEVNHNQKNVHYQEWNQHFRLPEENPFAAYNYGLNLPKETIPSVNPQGYALNAPVETPPLNQHNIFRIQPSVINEPLVFPEIIERSTGQPLLVNLQPSQVAYVNIPFNRTTALIYGGATEPHRNGQYFDDPSPYPEPEFLESEIGNKVPHPSPFYQNQLPNQKQVNGVIKVGNQIINKDSAVSENQHVPIVISPSKTNLPKTDLKGNNNEISLNIPSISFGLVEQANDFNAHVINHNDNQYSHSSGSHVGISNNNKIPLIPFDVMDTGNGNPYNLYEVPNNNKKPLHTYEGNNNSKRPSENYNINFLDVNRQSTAPPGIQTVDRQNVQQYPAFYQNKTRPNENIQENRLLYNLSVHNIPVTSEFEQRPNSQASTQFGNTKKSNNFQTTNNNSKQLNKPSNRYSSKPNVYRQKPTLKKEKPITELVEYMTPPPLRTNNVPKYHHTRRPPLKRPVPIPLRPNDNENTSPYPMYTEASRPKIHLPDSLRLNNQEQFPSVYDIDDHREDDLENEDGEVVQESNSRPLLSEEVPIEILKQKPTTTSTKRTPIANSTIRFPLGGYIRFPGNNKPVISNNARPFVTSRPLSKPTHKVPFKNPNGYYSLKPNHTAQNANLSNKNITNYVHSSSNVNRLSTTEPPISVIQNKHKDQPAINNKLVSGNTNEFHYQVETSTTEQNTISENAVENVFGIRKKFTEGPLHSQSTQKPIFVFIDEENQGNDFFHQNNKENKYPEEKTVTSLPVDSHTSNSNVVPHLKPINTQTEKPFVPQKYPSIATNEIIIKDEPPKTLSKVTTEPSVFSPSRRTTSEQKYTTLKVVNKEKFPKDTKDSPILTDMEIMKPPPLLSKYSPKPFIPKPHNRVHQQASNPINNSIRHPTQPSQTESSLPNSAPTQSYTPLVTDKISNPTRLKNEEVLGMSPPPPITTFKPHRILRPTYTTENIKKISYPRPASTTRATTTTEKNKYTRSRKPYTRRPTYFSTMTTPYTQTTPQRNKSTYDSFRKNVTTEIPTTERMIIPSPTIKTQPSMEVIIGHPNLNIVETQNTVVTKDDEGSLPVNDKSVELVGSASINKDNKTESHLVTTETNLYGTESSLATPKLTSDFSTETVHHSGNQIKIVDDSTKSSSTKSTIDVSTTRKHLPIRYITHTKTSTITVTKTTVLKSLGQPPTTQTILVTKTETSAVVETVTEVRTVVKPTSIIETITTTVRQASSLYPPDVYGLPYPSIQVKPTKTQETPIIEATASFTDDLEDDDLEDFIIRNTDPPISEEKKDIITSNHLNDEDTILVVMTDKNTKNVIKIPVEDSEETQERDELITNNQNNNILLGGIFIGNQPDDKPKDRCEPECKAARNEFCQKVDGTMKCVCRLGFARMFPDRPCLPTYTFNLNITLERIGRDSLHYYPDLNNRNSTDFVKFSSATREALDRMVMQSDLRDIFQGVEVHSFAQGPNTHGIVSKFYLQLSDNIEETRLEDILRNYLRNHNYSLGGTDIVASHLDKLKAQDFDECSNAKFHDCSENAQCFNLKGTYTCSCKEGFSDLSENMLYPGRVCSADQIGCDRCNYHGACFSKGGEEIFCECFPWYAGDNCHINLKVLLIALVTLGTILFALLLVCIIMTCTRRRPRNARMVSGMSFLPQRVANRKSTMDRKVIIQDTSSEDSKSETGSLPREKKLVKPKGALKKTSKVSIHEVNIPDQTDRSLTVMIPRAKYHPAPPTSPLMNYTTFDARKPSVPSIAEAKLLSYLDGPAPTKNEPNRKFSNAPSESLIEEKPLTRKTSGALISAGFEVSATVGNNMGTLGTTCGTEADRSENATLIQRISADLLSSIGTRSQFNTLRKSLVDDDLIDTSSNWLDLVPRVMTISESRSYDETTIPPPMKSFRNDYDSKTSSQHPNDEANTMTERDLGSTFLLPHTHLYKPDRGSDISGFESL